ncbi:hypothetical protein A6A03_14375 [Chloroflexus islandicus]|uniref:Uncharacterized protein n=1 Tax=Chloroflexus islandicus TaxID=1707952 RepID=A0A178MBX3_9CHLR|nr:hypothetical protein A6A03_14375 [Chloroflexus islandicus]
MLIRPALKGRARLTKPAARADAPTPLPLPRWGRGDGERSTGRYGIAQRSTVVINQMFCLLFNEQERGADNHLIEQETRCSFAQPSRAELRLRSPLRRLMPPPLAPPPLGEG